jgi:endonuclease I
MPKNIFLAFIFLCSIALKAQIPANYYQPATNLSGTALKTALYNIIKGHNQYQYTADTTDVWDILKQTDRDPNNADNVIEIYTGYSVNAAQEYNNGNGWEREHIWAKVHGGFDTDPPAGTDVHHIRPINGSVNSARNSRYFANCTTPYLYNGIPTGSFTSSSEWVWKPRDEDKGDIARMIFYMATRYEGENAEPDLEIIESIPANNNDPLPIMAKLSDLLQWHLEDTVDNWERNRNNIIYTYYQHNRNPFIDHPEFVDMIWGTTNIQENEAKLAITIYPNPATELINVNVTTPFKNLNYIISDLTGRTIKAGKLSSENAIVQLQGLTPGVYVIHFYSLNQNKFIKLIKD